MRNLWHEKENNPEFELIDADLEQAFANFTNSIKNFLGYSALNTFPHEVLNGYIYVPSDWLDRDETTKHYYEAVDKMNELSTNIVESYDILAKLARRKFAI